jgi:hypothetical protein
VSVTVLARGAQAPARVSGATFARLYGTEMSRRILNPLWDGSLVIAIDSQGRRNTPNFMVITLDPTGSYRHPRPANRGRTRDGKRPCQW